MPAHIGETIKTLRRKCAFTQEELAARLAVTPQAVSKWENGNGTPDISQLVPLARIFGITVDMLLSAADYGSAHTEAALAHEEKLMASSLPDAEKHLAAYYYFRAESEKDPANYKIMCKCINHGAEISRHTDFHGFLSDKPALREEIFADCARKNAVIARYCEDRTVVENSDFAMAWIFIHTKDFSQAQALIDRLPSLESGALRERITAQLLLFQQGFAREKACIDDNLRRLMVASAKEFYYDLEDYVGYAPPTEAAAFGQKLLDILEAWRAFDHLRQEAECHQARLRTFLQKISPYRKE